MRGRAAVAAHGLNKQFGAQPVLRDLSPDIARGEFVALLGRSGSGKSTFLRVLGALDGDVDGHILVPRRRAIVFQDPRLLPGSVLLRNVLVGLRARCGHADARPGRGSTRSACRTA